MVTPRHWDIIAISNKISMPTPANLDSHNGILEESKPPSMGICARMAQLKTNAPNLLNYSPIGLTWGKFGGGYKVWMSEGGVGNTCVDYFREIFSNWHHSNLASFFIC